MTGVTRSAIAWAMAQGDVTYSTTLAGHEGTPMLRLDDVKWLEGQLGRDWRGSRSLGVTGHRGREPRSVEAQGGGVRAWRTRR
jgi:hypothetical protein